MKPSVRIRKDGQKVKDVLSRPFNHDDCRVIMLGSTAHKPVDFLQECIPDVLRLRSAVLPKECGQTVFPEKLAVGVLRFATEEPDAGLRKRFEVERTGHGQIARIGQWIREKF